MSKIEIVRDLIWGGECSAFRVARDIDNGGNCNAVMIFTAGDSHALIASIYHGVFSTVFKPNKNRSRSSRHFPNNNHKIHTGKR